MRLLATVSALALLAAPAVADPGPGGVPSPWTQIYPDLAYDRGGIMLPSTVPGGSMGPGTINARGFYVNGVLLTGSGGGGGGGGGTVLPIATNPSGAIYLLSGGVTSGYLGNGAAAANLGFTPARSGGNSDITALTGLTTPLAPTEGGTGASSLAGLLRGNGTGPLSTAGAGDVATALGFTPFSAAGGSVVGNVFVLPASNVTPYTGQFATDGSLDWHLGASGMFATPGLFTSAPSVIGTHSLQSSPPYTTPDVANAGRAMLLINALSTNPNYGETPLTINFDVSSNLTSQLSNPNTQKAGIQENVLVNPTGGGNCATVTCPSVWAGNQDLRVRGSQGQVALALVNEFDYNNQYSGTDAFQVVNWIAYGGDYPVTAGEYYSNQFTDVYTGNATVSGQNVTLTSGSYTARLASGLYIGGTASTNFYHVDSVTDATHVHVTAVPPQGSTTYQWSPAAQTYGILMGDNAPTTPLTQSTDILLNTSGYDALQIGGNHVVSISTSADLAPTALSMRGNPSGAGQSACWYSFDDCQTNYAQTRHLFQMMGTAPFEIDTVAGANNGLRPIASVDATTEPTTAFAATGPTFGVTTGQARSDLNLLAGGADGAVVMKSPMRLDVFSIATLPACNLILTGDEVYVYDGGGAAAATYHAVVASGGSTFISSPAFCDSANWRYD